MSERTASRQGLRAVPQLGAAALAALQAPAEPPRTLLWPADSTTVRAISMGVSVAIGTGLTGGSIALHIHVLHLGPNAGWPLGVVQCLPLIIAARHPLVAWRIAAIGLLAGVLVTAGRDEFWPWPVTSFLAVVVMLFAVGVSYERHTSLGAGVVTIAGLLVPAVVVDGMALWFGIILAGVVTIALVFGDAVGGRYSAEASLAEQAELRRRDLARQAVLEERARIARELHDVVAHHMSVIAMQAEAAPYKIPDLPDTARDTFGILRDAAREALAETRRVVGLLRADDEVAERLPQPGLARLDDLIAGARQTGLDARSRIIGLPRPVAAGVDLSAYRIVQESLSNAARYAPGSQVQVELHYDEDALLITVTDDGPRRDPERSGGGHGLVGMRERVAMLGGALSAGPVAARTIEATGTADAVGNVATTGTGGSPGLAVSGDAAGTTTAEADGPAAPSGAEAEGWTVRADLPYGDGR